MFSIGDYYALVIENTKLENELDYHKQRAKDQEEYIDALKEKVKALEELCEVKEKLIDKYKEKAGLLKRMIIENRCKCSSPHSEGVDEKPLLSKEDFVDIINQIKIGYEKRNKLADALEEVNEGWFICNLGEEWVNTLITLLCKVMNDVGEEEEDNFETIVEWWLFEDVNKTSYITENGEETSVSVETPEQLYDYLIENNF